MSHPQKMSPMINLNIVLQFYISL